MTGNAMMFPKYQRFVAWRYLLGRERQWSRSIIAVIGFCLWIAAGMGIASLLYPLSDITRLAPPNPPVWMIPLIGLTFTQPIVGLLVAASQWATGDSSRRWLVYSVYWGGISLAALSLYQKSIAEEPSPYLPIIGLVLLSRCGNSLVQGTILRNWMLGRHVSKATVFFAVLSVPPIGLLAWLLSWCGLRSKVRTMLAFAFALELAATQMLVLYLVAGCQPMSLLFAGGVSAFGWLFLAFGSVAIASIGLCIVSPKHRSLMGRIAAFATVLCICLCTAAFVQQGIDKVSESLQYFGGWSSYTPPMEFVMTSLVAAAIALLGVVLLLVRYSFSFFTTVSIGGVTIGTMALVIVLSVMSGFENDLRQKILGFSAHIQISRHDEIQFSGYQEAQDILETTPGVVGYTPFLNTEAYFSNDNNYRNVTLKGIDPDRVAGVTEIVHKLEEGDERALEKIWPLAEDGSITGPPADEVAPMEFELDDELIDFSGGLDEVEVDVEVEGEPSGDAGVLDADAIARSWEQDLMPQDYIQPEVAVLDGVLVGKELVKEIGLSTGYDVQAISPWPDISPDGLSIPRMKDFRVAGKFFSGMYEYDLKYVYCSLRSLQDFLDLGDVVNGIEVRVENPRETAGVVSILQKSLGPEYLVQDWKELNKALFSALKLEKIAMFFILVIVVLVASFSIVGNLIMVVIEKAKEIAILKTLGSSDTGVMKIFVVQGFFIGLVGTGLGVALGLGACYLGITYGVPLDPDVYYIDKLPIQVEGWSVFAVGFSGIAISIVATIYPAFIAARMRPVKGLRWD